MGAGDAGGCSAYLERKFFESVSHAVILNSVDRSVLISIEPIELDSLFTLTACSVFSIVLAVSAITIVLTYIVYSKFVIQRIVQKIRHN
jgi:hypothetical protein